MRRYRWLLAAWVLGEAVACHHQAATPVIDVSGVILDFNHYPVSGARFEIPGHGIALTGSDGRFDAAGVQTPYSVIIQHPSGFYLVFADLTRADPTLITYLDVAPAHAAVLGGTITGLLMNTSSRATQIAFTSHGVVLSDLPIIDYSTGTYSLSVAWRGTAGSISGQLMAFQAEGGPPTFDGMDFNALTVADQAVVTSADLSLLPVPLATVSGSIILEPGYSPAQFSYALQNAGGDQQSVWFGGPAFVTSSFSFETPSLPGQTLSIGAYAVNPDVGIQSNIVQFGVSPGSSGLSFHLLDGVRITKPANGSVGVSLPLKIRWTPIPDSVYVVTVGETATFPGGDPVYEIFTDKSEITVPDLSDFGSAFQPGSEIYVNVGAQQPFSIDDPAVVDPYLPIESGQRTFQSGDAVVSTLSQ